MSKSLGNSPDPLELIQKYGADGVRVGMLLSSPAGNVYCLIEIFVSKEETLPIIWNSFRCPILDCF